MGRLERCWRWCRRRPALAALAGVSATAAVVLLTGVLIYNARLQDAAAEANRQHELADSRYRAARDSLRKMLDLLHDERVAGVPRLQELRRELLEDALFFISPR